MTTPPKTSRRTAAGGGAPARSRKPGNPGFSGYQYQVEVTIWVALDLMLAKGSADSVEIEPRTDEDLQAAVIDPSTASIDLTARGAHLKLILQAKTRSTSPWPATAFADILLGHDTDGTGRKRRRPLTMLEDDPANRYVFVTNEASAEALRPHEGEHLLDFPEVDVLPPHCRDGLTDLEQAALAPRILLLTSVTREILRSRISTLLSRHGHVPLSKHEQCLRDLRDAVRHRIEGAHRGRWDLSAVLADLVRHGGSRAPTRDMDHYIRPRSYDQIKQRLEDLHAVVIAGASGTGKTLTADILELDLRSRDPAFEVVEAELGPGQVRREFSRSEPILFHLRDPWGSNRVLPGADRWSGELPKLLDHAGPNRKFLITSRSDVMKSAGPDLPEDLQPYLVRIDVGDYGASRLAEIYDNISSDLTGHARQLAKQHRKNALGKLTRPYEVKRFLTALLQEDRARPTQVSDIIATSQIKAISNVIAEQLSPLGPDGAEAAAILWAMLNALTAVARETFAKLGQRIRAKDGTMRPDLDGLIDFLMAGQNLRRNGTALAFHHPRVEDGLRRAFMRHPREAERALSATLNVLLHWDRPDDDWGLETGLAILRSAARVNGIDLAIAPGSAGRLDAYLGALALSAGNGSDYEGALRDLEQFGSESDTMARLARLLLGVDQKQSGFLRRWDVSMPADNEILMLGSDPRTQTVVERFVRELLPFSNLSYQSEFVSLLELLASDLAAAFLDGLEAVADPGDPLTNIDVLVAGALRGPSPDYDRIIERFARSASDADAWMTGFRSDYAAEHRKGDAFAMTEQHYNRSQKISLKAEGMALWVKTLLTAYRKERRKFRDLRSIKRAA